MEVFWVFSSEKNILTCSPHRCGMNRQQRRAAAHAPAARSQPNLARAHNAQGIALARQSRFREAAELFLRALSLQPGFAEAHNNLGKAQALLGQPEQAIASFSRAISLQPGYAEAYNNLGITLTEQGRLADAISAYRQALRAKPGYADVYNNLSIAHRYAGDLPSAIAACESALSFALTGNTYLNLANLKRFTPADPHLRAMEALAAHTPTIPPESRMPLHFALGKAYDDCRDPARAFAHFLAGNTMKRQTIAYDEALTLGMMDRIRQSFSAEHMQGLRGSGHSSAAPIFILGMPRSGSTLLEQILGAHPQVFAAGERTDFTRIATAVLAPGRYPEAAADIAQANLHRLGGHYLDRMRVLAGGAPRFTDKMPGHFLYAGLIHLVFPNALIIHTRRAAADTCFSCFTKLFREGHLYSFDLAELGRYYRAYARLMDHWRSVIPANAMIDIDYEALVADPRTATEPILARCGLPWAESCLDFQTNARPVLTASATQIRAGIHTRSIGRAHAYAEFLHPLGFTDRVM
jgi:tetratricopeptide (TPR) repeat protein